MTPRGQTKKTSVIEVLTADDGGKPEEHMKLYNSNPRLYEAAVMFLIKKQVPVRQQLVHKALGVAIAAYDERFLHALYSVATALDLRDAVRLFAKGSRAFGVSLTGGRHKNRQELIKQWFRMQTPESLQEQILVGGDVLTEIADMAHPNEKDWAGQPWIAHAAYGSAEIPQDSMIVHARTLRYLITNKGSDADIIAALDQIVPWHYIKTSFDNAHRQPSARVKDILIQKYSIRGVLKNYESFADRTEALVKKLETAKSLSLSFTLPFEKYLLRSGSMEVQQALLKFTSKQFEQLYISPNIPATVIGMDVSGSMEAAIQMAATVSAMIGSKIGSVRLFAFNDRCVELTAPKDIASVIRMIGVTRAGGSTAISSFFEKIAPLKPHNVIIISDGMHNAGNDLGTTIGQLSPSPKIFFLKVGMNFDTPLDDVLAISEMWHRSVVINQLSQLDSIIPMLSYDEYAGLENELMDMADMFVPPVEIEPNICAACNRVVTEPINMGCAHVFHKECLIRYWDLIGTKTCPFGCMPVRRCGQCSGPVSLEIEMCGWCGYTFVHGKKK